VAKVRLGMIGCGGIAQWHMSLLEKMEEAQMVAFCDIREEAARQSAEKYSGVAYTKHEEMFAKENLDAIFLCIPPFAHTDQAIMAAQKGIHVFAEKPVALNMAKALEIQEALDKSGVVASVGYCVRYVPATARVKQMLAKNPAHLAFGWYMGGIPEAEWLRQMKTCGGQIVEQATHLVDLLCYLVGDVDTISASYSHECFRNLPGVDVPDTAAVTLHFKNGAVGSFLNTWAGVPGPKPGTWIGGKDFFIQLTYNDITVTTPEGTKEDPVVLDEGYVNEDRTFLRAVQTGDKSGILCPFSDGVKTLAVTLAANKAAAEGRTVKVEEMYDISS
jgi:predicted dehydrogenase